MVPDLMPSGQGGLPALEALLYVVGGDIEGRLDPIFLEDRQANIDLAWAGIIESQADGRFDSVRPGKRDGLTRLLSGGPILASLQTGKKKN